MRYMKIKMTFQKEIMKPTSWNIPLRRKINNVVLIIIIFTGKVKSIDYKLHDPQKMVDKGCINTDLYINNGETNLISFQNQIVIL